MLPINKQQFVNQVEKIAQQRTIPSQLQAIRKWAEALLKWQTLGDKSQEALTLIKQRYCHIFLYLPTLPTL
ncbi:MAG: hypothetical protein F6K48_16070 [Okeania sp. SIO3H1]|uniref:hypothetical protein n=1 Tax=Okeania sp. SIO1I7 TaxID=2607772 RepID=UPI0013CA5E9A|nr:hypothetical protein [Okeania sp. SIO1I7]NEN90341.1 hypothetical protein [Okeania sp. SIO3H1]NET30171.1 hypothetical protein [Okeania sp. SIO1I7]